MQVGQSYHSALTPSVVQDTAWTLASPVVLSVVLVAILGAPYEYVPAGFTRTPYGAPASLQPDISSGLVDPLTIGHAMGNASQTSLLLFLHGWPDHSRVWDSQMHHFCGGQHAAHHCVALDLPGYAPGAKAPVGNGPDFDGLSDRLAAATEALL